MTQHTDTSLKPFSALHSFFLFPCGRSSDMVGKRISGQEMKEDPRIRKSSWETCLWFPLILYLDVDQC